MGRLQGLTQLAPQPVYSFGERLLEAGKAVEQRRRVIPILSAALEAVDPYHAVRRALALESDHLRVFKPVDGANGPSYPLDRLGRIIVVGAGKAGAPMARAVEDVLEGRLYQGTVNVKRGHVEPTRRIRLHEGGHPIPDPAGVEGTRRIVELLESADENDLVICLISGGGSALLQLPVEGVSLEEIQSLTDTMLRAGATINQLNTVRKRLSQVSGGRLARLAQPARMLSLILSDVVGNPLDVIASGPTVPDSTTYADAAEVLDNLQLWDDQPAGVREYLRAGLAGEFEDTPGPEDGIFQVVENVIVASNEVAARAAVREAKHQGFEAMLLTTYLEGEAKEVGKVCAALAQEIATSGQPLERPCCLVTGGETTVTVRGQGKGGRNQELALAAASKLAGLSDVLLVALATDGNDGPTEAAGAVADGGTIERARALGLKAETALAENDAFPFFDALGDLLLTGPTNTNVNDLTLVFAF